MKRKKHIKKEEAHKSPVYVQINNPTTMRRVILQSALDTTRLAQDYAALIKTKEKEKSVAMLKFSKVISSLTRAEKRLESSLPKIKVEEKIIHTPKEGITKLEIKEKPASHDITKLEKELADIEKKLSRL